MTKRKVNCPECGKQTAVTKAGVIRSHKVGGEVCDGSYSDLHVFECIMFDTLTGKRFVVPVSGFIESRGAYVLPEFTSACGSYTVRVGKSDAFGRRKVSEYPTFSGREWHVWFK